MNSVRPIRVCFVIDFWRGRAGVELQLSMLLKYIDRSRVEPFVLVMKGERETLLAASGCPVDILNISRFWKWNTVRAAYRYRKFLKQNKIDVVQFLQLENTWKILFALTAIGSSVKALFGFRVNIGYQSNRKRNFFGRILNRFFIKHTIANAEACRKSAVEQEGAKPERFTIIPNLLEMQQFADIPVWQQTNAAQRKIGLVGNLKRIKGTDIFIDAAKIILDKLKERDRERNGLSPLSVQFELAGNGEKEPYRKRTEDLGIAEHITLLGSVSDIPAFLATLDVAVLCSRTEGLPNALMEYMAAGRPIVVSDVGGCGELIQNEVNGLLIPPDNPQALADAIFTLLDNPAQAEKYALAARNGIKDNYDAVRLANQWCNVYER